MFKDRSKKLVLKSDYCDWDMVDVKGKNCVKKLRMLIVFIIKNKDN